jgi:hypothetical protein
MGSVPSVERYGLLVAVVVLVVSSAVAQVDPSDERHVGVWGAGMSQDDQFLVVRAAPPNALIEEYFPARVAHLVGQEPVLFGAERETVRVGPPDEAPHIHSASNQIAQERANLGTHVAQALVGVAAPVGEMHLVGIDERHQRIDEFCEIRRSVNESAHFVALGPRFRLSSTGVDPRRRVAALVGL